MGEHCLPHDSHQWLKKWLTLVCTEKNPEHLYFLYFTVYFTVYVDWHMYHKWLYSRLSVILVTSERKWRLMSTTPIIFCFWISLVKYHFCTDLIWFNFAICTYARVLVIAELLVDFQNMRKVYSLAVNMCWSNMTVTAGL